MERSKNFHIWLGIAALLIAGSAAFFSVFGLSKLFSGAALSVIIMAGSLEFGKLVTAVFRYCSNSTYCNNICGYLWVLIKCISRCNNTIRKRIY